MRSSSRRRRRYETCAADISTCAQRSSERRPVARPRTAPSRQRYAAQSTTDRDSAAAGWWSAGKLDLMRAMRPECVARLGQRRRVVDGRLREEPLEGPLTRPTTFDLRLHPLVPAERHTNGERREQIDQREAGDAPLEHRQHAERPADG